MAGVHCGGCESEHQVDVRTVGPRPFVRTTLPIAHCTLHKYTLYSCVLCSILKVMMSVSKDAIDKVKYLL